MWVFYTNLISPHTAPLANALQTNAGGCAYIYQRHGGEPCRTNHVLDDLVATAVCEEDDLSKARRMLAESEGLILGVRNFDLMERRVQDGRFTAYQSERWFKPESLLALGKSESVGRGVWISGFWKMLLPFAIRRAIRIMRLFKSDKFLYLPIGIHAARDMARLCGLMNGDLRCLFRAPVLMFEKKPFGKIWLREGGDSSRYCLGKMRMWGYFVAPSRKRQCEARQIGRNVIRVLWVGRMLDLKNVDGIIRAVGGDSRFVLDVYGSGPVEAKLRKLASKYNNVNFGEMVPINEVRDLMRGHDIYVLASNEFDGWGAVVNEALEEGMKVVGTYEAGASATMLPESNLFHSGDWKMLRKILLHPIKDVGIESWTARCAAAKLASYIEEV